MRNARPQMMSSPSSSLRTRAAAARRPTRTSVVPGIGVRAASSNSSRMRVDGDANPAVGKPVHADGPDRVAVAEDVLGAGIAERRARSSRRFRTAASRNGAPTSIAPMPPSNSGRRGLLKSSLSSPVTSHVAARVPAGGDEVGQVDVAEALVLALFARLHPLGAEADGTRRVAHLGAHSGAPPLHIDGCEEVSRFRRPSRRASC